ncbi:MAG TPA: 3-deoxy-7-phosphoheptulonate synthase [Gemmatimonadaceae bacterium]|nr:3-deoxy-7-phosphoheptulonate synthase [Gemmatimonadaceae bacterium]
MTPGAFFCWVVREFRQSRSVPPGRGGRFTLRITIADPPRKSTSASARRPLTRFELAMQSPHPLASHHPDTNPDRTIVRAGGAILGAESIAVIAGPCSVEGREMLLATARAVGSAGAVMLRGGAYKPRTSPYAFQGMGELALELLAEVRAITGLPVVTEVLDPRQVELVAARVDMLQVGARNMQNFALLSEVGRGRVPVLLKRGPSATVSELLHAAEYILAEGNTQVVLCERGIRTFETATRNTLDVAAIPVLKAATHLPVFVDPSHAGGKAALVLPLAAAAIAAGADGLIVEVHPAPASAMSDGEQSLTPDSFAAMMRVLAPIAEACGRSLLSPSATTDGPRAVNCA